MNRTRLVICLASLVLLTDVAFALQLHDARPHFRISAVPRAVKNHLLVDLSVTNVSMQDQLFWRAKDYCTNQHWKTDSPGISLHDCQLEQAKTCRWTCEHRITLRPGEIFTLTLPLEIGRGARTGKRLVRFANIQPPPELIRLIGQSHAPENRQYEQQVFWSEPVAINIERRFLGT